MSNGLPHTTYRLPNRAPLGWSRYTVLYSGFSGSMAQAHPKFGNLYGPLRDDKRLSWGASAIYSGTTVRDTRIPRNRPTRIDLPRKRPSPPWENARGEAGRSAKVRFASPNIEVPDFQLQRRAWMALQCSTAIVDKMFVHGFSTCQCFCLMLCPDLQRLVLILHSKRGDPRNDD